MKLEITFDEGMIEPIKDLIRTRVRECNADGVVIGLSGGLDSAVTAKLCTETLGRESVLTLMLYDNVTTEEDKEDARNLAEMLAVEHEIIDISNFIKPFYTLCAHAEQRSQVIGNVKARLRMIILYYHANLLNRVVVGTSNKSEIAVGYFTKFGDGGVDIMPLGDLYKTQVRELARYLKIPERVIEKSPSASLWEGQTDEDELGMPYELLDRILFGIECRLSSGEIAERLSLRISDVERVKGMVLKNHHKRKVPPIPKLGMRTFGVDWRE